MTPFGKIASKIFLWQRAAHVVALLRNILLAWFISKEGFGVFAIALNISSYFALFTTLDFRTALFTAKAPSQKLWNTQWSLEVVLSALPVLLALLAFPWIQSSRGSAVAIALVGVLAALLIEALVSSKLYHFEREMKYPFVTAVRTMTNIASFLICLLLAMRGWGWYALVIDRLLVASIGSILILVKSEMKVSFGFDRESLNYFWNVGKILFIVGMLSKIYLGLDMYLVGYLLGEGAAGVYLQAFKWALIPMDIGTGFLATMALSWYASQVHLGKDKLIEAYRKITFHLFRFCLWVATMLVIFLTDVFRWLYKPEWHEVPILFVFFLPYALGRPLMQNGYQVLQSMGNMKPVLWVAFFQTIASVAFCFYGSQWGLHGLALAAGGSVIVGWCLSTYLINRELRPISHGKLFVPMILFAFAFGCSWLSQTHLSEINSVISRLLIGGAYSALAYREWSSRKAFADQP